MRKLFTSDGTPLVLGDELGSGGEGSVYEVPSHPRQVAKLYHHPLDPGKKAKLRFMASAADDKLLHYVAWPQDTLHAWAGGEVIGFLMPKVTGRSPVHNIYNPGNRLKDHPKAAWDFLLFIARNIAASFEVIHSRGHVIGDVNENSVMAGSDSTVMLIDSDSFQVDAAGDVHLCKVGVPNFTPPELQKITSFNTFRRTPNHDNFGLALLIFHLLMGGRHPFSGVSQRAEAEPSLPADIRYFRYSYANDHPARGVRPPPGSVPVGIFPPELAAMFQKAFTETGVSGTRPTAGEWVVALDSLRTSLIRCRESAIHLYPKHLSKCPWCDLSGQGILLFLDLGAAVAAPLSNTFILAKAWVLIEAVTPPKPLAVPYPANFKVKGMRLQDDIAKTGTILFLRLTLFIIALSVTLAKPDSFFVAFVVGGLAWIAAGYVGNTKRIAEKRRRQGAEDAARRNYEALLVQARKETGPEGFHRRKAKFTKARAEWENLPQAEREEINRIIAAASHRQKQRYLGTHLVEDASVPGLGPHRKGSLKAAGIRSAADLTTQRINGVPGFGPGLVTALMQWKNACEAGFSFNSAIALSPQERDAVRTDFAKRRRELERTLAQAPDELDQWRKNAIARMAALKTSLDRAAKELAEAEADLLVLKY
jgi:DNA-binding helix-hairpin-helix protein with protein kinase domain